MMGTSREARHAKGLVLAGALIILCGCAEVTVRSGDEIATSSGFGLAAARFDRLTNPVSINTRGFGVISGMGRFTVGWLDEELIVFPDASQCRLLVVVRAQGEIEAVIDALRASRLDSDGICIQRSNTP